MRFFWFGNIIDCMDLLPNAETNPQSLKKMGHSRIGGHLGFGIKKKKKKPSI